MGAGIRTRPLAELDHPSYFNGLGGAWWVTQYFKYLAECQAICRLVHALICQVGCPGTGDVVVVWSDPDIDDGATALEALTPPAGGLGTKPMRTINGYSCTAALVDRYPEEGAEYQTDYPDQPNYIGDNNYEACLRFEYGGVKKYYGGGAGAYDSPQQVILAFHALVWVATGGHHGATCKALCKGHAGREAVARQRRQPHSVRRVERAQLSPNARFDDRRSDHGRNDGLWEAPARRRTGAE